MVAVTGTTQLAMQQAMSRNISLLTTMLNGRTSSYPPA
jgi:hypothetical protein